MCPSNGNGLLRCWRRCPTDRQRVMLISWFWQVGAQAGGGKTPGLLGKTWWD